MFAVSQIVMHPSYVTRQLADDIALINLNSPVEWSDRVQPACLPNPDQDSFAGLVATVAGWGWTDEVKNGRLPHYFISLEAIMYCERTVFLLP